jgi:hypothetical protein
MLADEPDGSHGIASSRCHSPRAHTPSPSLQGVSDTTIHSHHELEDCGQVLNLVGRNNLPNRDLLIAVVASLQHLQ